MPQGGIPGAPLVGTYNCNSTNEVAFWGKTLTGGVQGMCVNWKCSLGEFIYTPNGSANGASDSFSYYIYTSDNGQSQKQIVTIEFE